MLYIAENLKSLRKGKDLTQEEVAEILGVSPQSVSKWERGDTYPDITFLPALANFFSTSVDALIGMDKINDTQTRNAVFTTAQKHWRSGDIIAAIDVYSEGLKTFPNDKGIMSDLAMALALEGGTDKLSQAIALCERVLTGSSGEKVHHTTRVALCFIYLKAGLKEKAVTVEKNLPHVRESREIIVKQVESKLNAEDIDAYLTFIAIGESDQQDIIQVDFGMNMIPICTDFDLTGKIGALRDEIGGHSNKGLQVLPVIRVRDNASLSPNQIRVRHYADILIDKEFTNCGEAVNEIMAAIKKTTQNR
jgi:transcriptional regulator with XRE-family HTH domain